MSLFKTPIIAVYAFIFFTFPLFPVFAVNQDSSDFEASSSECASTDPFDVNGDYSVSVWVRFESLPSPGANQGIFGRYMDESGHNQNSLHLNNNGGQYRFIWAVDVAAAAGWSNFEYYNVSVSTNTWYHLFATYATSTGTLKLYLNGSELTASSGSDGVAGDMYFIGSSYVGCIFEAPDRASFFDGMIDDLRVYTSIVENPYTAACQETSYDGMSGYYWFASDWTDKAGSFGTMTTYNTPAFSSTTPFSDDCSGEPAAAASSTPPVAGEIFMIWYAYTIGIVIVSFLLLIPPIVWTAKVINVLR